jgi:hypothetical protein
VLRHRRTRKRRPAGTVVARTPATTRATSVRPLPIHATPLPPRTRARGRRPQARVVPFASTSTLRRSSPSHSIGLH